MTLGDPIASCHIRITRDPENCRQLSEEVCLPLSLPIA